MQRRERDRREEHQSEFKERLVAVNRVSKTVKGGRNMRFVALVVVGDENGRVGVGMGKAKEVPEAIRKANEDGKKHLINVPTNGTTIPHPIVGYYGTAKVVLLPAEEGAGVIAGGAARPVLELAGIMSDSPLVEVNEKLEAAKDAAHALGVGHGIDPFMTLSFMALPVIPTLRITTRGVFDVTTQRYI